MTLLETAALVALAICACIITYGYSSDRWIKPAIKRHRHRRAVKRLGVRAFIW